MRTKIEVDNWTIARFWLVLLGILGAIILIYWARHALAIIGLATFLAIAANPLVSKLSRKFFHNKRTAATAILFVSFLLILVAFAFLIVPSVTSQVYSFIETAPNTISKTISSLKNNSIVEQFNLTSYFDEINNYINLHKQTWASQIGSIMFNGVSSIITFVFSGIIVLTLTLLMLTDAPRITKGFWRFYKNKRVMEHHQKLATRMAGTITSFVSGQLAQVTISGTCAGIVVFILSITFHISTNLIAPVALIVSLMSLIPLVGATIGGIIGMLMITMSNIPAAIVFIIYFIVYQQLENNVIAPFIQSKATSLSSLTVLIAITVGIYLFGIVGALIAIPAAGCIKILLEDNFDFYKEN
ncbi:MAG: AI-2E family transporter [Candidatus Saccharibacteria bacterium]|nr:AI-2E family transporter [Candidatus Saccharibacteria bacterium]